MSLPSGFTVEIHYNIEGNPIELLYTMSGSDTSNGYYLPEEALIEEHNGIPIEWYLDSNYTIKAEPLMNVEDYLVDNFVTFFRLELYGKYYVMEKYLDFEGVKYLWSKIYEQDRLLANSINNKANKTDIVQSDWDQNDTASISYIKNRIAYTYPEFIKRDCILEKGRLSLDALRWGAYNSKQLLEVIKNTDIIIFEIGEQDFPLIFSEGYPVLKDEQYIRESKFNTINGTHCPVTAIESWNEDGKNYNCSISFNNPNYFEEKGIDFSSDLINIYSATSNEIVVPLDEKFIPDTIARKSNIPDINYPVTSVNGQTGDVVIDVQSDWEQTDETAVDFIKNKPDLNALRTEITQKSQVQIITWEADD